ncbi:MAG: FxsA family protein [Pseudomonadota bacterium]|nr:FxsA family protein [Pseudomonadota bacterium]
MIVFFLFFVGIPLLELYLLIQVGAEIGALPTIGLTILTAIIGGFLVRLQGFSVLMRVRDAVDRGEVPALEMLDGALLLAAGLVLLLPGFFTDAVGFLLLVPALRRLLIARFVRFVPQSPPGRDHTGPRVIEGEYRRDKE